MTEGLIALIALMTFAYIGARIDARNNYAHTHIGYVVSTDGIIWRVLPVEAPPHERKL